MQMSTADTAHRPATVRVPPESRTSTGMETAAAMEPADTKFHLYTTPTNTARESTTLSGDSAKNTPSAVATPLATLEPQENRELMPEKGAQSHNRHGGTSPMTGSRQPAHRNHRDESLEQVNQKGKRAPYDTDFPRHVCRADVAASCLGDVDMSDRTGNELSEGNGAQQICARSTIEYFREP